MLREKFEYIHINPVRRGFVEEAIHWTYSSTRNYNGYKGLIDVKIGWI